MDMIKALVLEQRRFKLYRTMLDLVEISGRVIDVVKAKSDLHINLAPCHITCRTKINLIYFTDHLKKLPDRLNSIRLVMAFMSCFIKS